jgi:hypothetical protein
MAICIRVYRYRTDVEALATANYPQRYLAPVGNQNLVHWLVVSLL